MEMSTLQRMRIVFSPYGMMALAVLSYGGPLAFTYTVAGTKLPLMVLLGIMALLIRY